MNPPVHSQEEFPLQLDSRRLASLKRQVPFPCELTLLPEDDDHGAGAAALTCLEPLRLLPGRRLVCRARWRAAPVVAKLFIHPAKAGRDYDRELAGHRLFTAAEIATPALVARGRLGGGGRAVLYRYLEDAVSLGSLVPLVPTPAALEKLGAVLAAIARMHRAGFRQVDLHLNNFLWAGGRLFTLDSGDLAVLPAAEKARTALVRKNLADLLSQLPLAYEPCFADLLASYNRAAKPDRELTVAELAADIRSWRRWRQRHYVRKAGRDSSDFVVARSWRRLLACRRGYDAGPWREFYRRLDELVVAGERLKDGNSATVALVEWAGEKVVIKRYNIKNLAHWLRRCWRPSRGW
ncbi:MAG: serine/threonine protein kinase, partial [Deltaproteobacteria bacterium]|nr:serine/threonine protein kinase [Deltaproteobacteria bacterium]